MLYFFLFFMVAKMGDVDDEPGDYHYSVNNSLGYSKNSYTGSSK